MTLLEGHLARALRLQNPTFQTHIQTDAGLVAMVIRSGDRAFVVEVKNTTASVESLGRVHLLAHHPEWLGPLRPAGDVKGVLAAPSFARNVEALAKRAGITTIIVPRALLGGHMGDVRALTTPKAWNVVVEVLKARHSPGIRQLAEASGTSVGWTSGIVRSLQAKQIIDESGELRDSGVLALLDHVATERPLDSLKRASFGMGVTGWEEADDAIRGHWAAMQDRLEPPDFYRCGQTAAMIHVDHILRHDAVQVYARDVATVRYFLEDPSRTASGVRLLIYAPDRPLATGAGGKGSKRYVGLSQTLLDVAGMGYSTRDTSLKLVEALQRGHQRA